jgi:23S rRNA (adenine2503-C2)-methyltransferase
MLPEELEAVLPSIGIKGFKAGEVLRSCYERPASSFDAMTTLSKAERALLKEHFALTAFNLEKESQSPDGTRKFLYQLNDHRFIETVLIPEETRLTLCVSTQVGCPVRCNFCASGMLGLKRNLTTAEIVGQFIASWKRSEKSPTNVVFMGMGEPFFNFDNVMKAIQIMHHPQGLRLGLRKITLSTVGIVGFIEKLFSAPVRPKIAISLHAPTDEIRRAIIPHPKILSVREIVTFIRRYTQKTGHRVTLEYVMIAGVNSSPKEAHILGKLLRGLNVKINLIPFNPVSEVSFSPPSLEAVNEFGKIVSSYGIMVMVRAQRGDEISAACGQLRLLEIAKEGKSYD